MNFKKIIAVFSAAAMIVSVTPAVGASKAPEPASSKQPAKSAQSSKTAVEPTKLTKINHESLMPLLREAQARYWYAMSGGKGGEMNTFEYKGSDYRYLSEDIGTRAKLLDYLMETYTKQASEYLIKKFFIEHEGKMAQLNADGGNILDYDKATAKMLSMTDTKRTYRLTVPYPEQLQGPERIVVKFEKVGGYWRIATAPHAVF